MAVKDILRPNVSLSIKQLENGGVTTRMMTGDNIVSAV